MYKHELLWGLVRTSLLLTFNNVEVVFFLLNLKLNQLCPAKNAEFKCLVMSRTFM